MRKKLTDARDNFEKKLKEKLNRMSPQARLNFVLLVMAFYLGASLYILIRVIYTNSNNSRSQLNIEHIRKPEVNQIKTRALHQDDTIFNYQSH